MAGLLAGSFPEPRFTEAAGGPPWLANHPKSSALREREPQSGCGGERLIFLYAEGILRRPDGAALAGRGSRGLRRAKKSEYVEAQPEHAGRFALDSLSELAIYRVPGAKFVNLQGMEPTRWRQRRPGDRNHGEFPRGRERP